MGERIKVDLEVNLWRNPKCTEVNPLRCSDLGDQGRNIFVALAGSGHASGSTLLYDLLVPPAFGYHIQ
jgi:hypothetical protein